MRVSASASIGWLPPVPILGEHALDAAVLLEQQQRHVHQRVATLAGVRTRALQHATQQSVEQSHERPPSSDRHDRTAIV